MSKGLPLGPCCNPHCDAHTMRVPLYGKARLCRDCDNAVREAKGGGSRIMSDQELAMLDTALEEKLAEPIVEGRKDDGGKLRYDLLPPDALAELVRVYTVGAANYGPRNWERGIMMCRIFAALMRHSWAWFLGEENDPDDGIHHMAHAAWNCMALIVFSKRGMTHLDDRPIITRAE